MSTSLQNTITQLASTFAEEVLKSLRAMSLEEILAATQSNGGARRPGRPAAAPKAAPHAAKAAPAAAAKGRRRTPDDVAGAVDAIQSLLRKHKGGLRSEQLRAMLGFAKNEMPRTIAQALETKKIKKTGQKRSTTYFAR